jgi:peptidoglycan/LPS O-acetylase OafA/YrhL
VGKNIRIDWLRTLAITPVVLVHMIMVTGSWPSETYRVFTLNAYYGVTLFFVISGYLITETAIARYATLDRIDAPTFYRSRVGRLLPMLALMVTVTLALSLFGAPGFAAEHPWLALAYVLLLAANFAVGATLPGWHPLWSLAVEETFYLVYPWACRFLKARHLVAIAILMIAAAPLARYWQGVDALLKQWGCFDAIAIGCLLAGVNRRYLVGRFNWWTSTAIGISGAALFLLVLTGPLLFSSFVFGPSLAALAAALMVVWAIQYKPSPPGLTASLLALPGRNCYEIYLLHWPIGIVLLKAGWFDPYLKTPGFDLASLWAYVLIVVVSAGLAKYVTGPIGRWIVTDRRPRPAFATEAAE